MKTPLPRSVTLALPLTWKPPLSMTYTPGFMVRTQFPDASIWVYRPGDKVVFELPEHLAAPSEGRGGLKELSFSVVSDASGSVKLQFEGIVGEGLKVTLPDFCTPPCTRICAADSRAFPPAVSAPEAQLELTT